MAETLGDDVAARNAIAPFMQAWNPVELKDVARVYATHEAQGAALATSYVRKLGEVSAELTGFPDAIADVGKFSLQWQGRGHNLQLAKGNAWMIEDTHAMLTREIDWVDNGVVRRARGVAEYHHQGAVELVEIDKSTFRMAFRDTVDSFYYGKTFTGQSTAVLPDLRFEGTVISGPEKGLRKTFVVEHKFSDGTVKLTYENGKQFTKYVKYDERVADPNTLFIYRIKWLVDDPLRIKISQQERFQIFTWSDGWLK